MRIFQIHIGMFFIYNTIIGYLLVRGEYGGYLGLTFYFIAMAAHFITIDWSLRTSHKDVYEWKMVTGISSSVGMDCRDFFRDSRSYGISISGLYSRSYYIKHSERRAT